MLRGFTVLLSTEQTRLRLREEARGIYFGGGAHMSVTRTWSWPCETASIICLAIRATATYIRRT